MTDIQTWLLIIIGCISLGGSITSVLIFVKYVDCKEHLATSVQALKDLKHEIHNDHRKHNEVSTDLINKLTRALERNRRIIKVLAKIKLPSQKVNPVLDAHKKEITDIELQREIVTILKEHKEDS